MNQSLSKSKQIEAAFFILTMVIACTRDYGDLHLGAMTLILEYGIGIFWVGLAFIKMLYKGKLQRSVEDKDTLWFLKMYMLPQIVFFAYSLLIIGLGLSKREYLGTNLTSFVPISLAIIAYYFFKEKAFKYVCISIAISWGVSILFALLQNGPSILSQAIIQGYIDSYYTSSSLARDNYFEIHDIVLAVGYFLVFYFYSKIDKTKDNISWKRRYLFLFLIVAFLGIKRVALLGVVLALVCRLPLLSKRGNRLRKCLIIGWIAFALCILFIYIFSSGDWFFDILRAHGINPAGRNRYYKAILELSTFSPGWLGLGRGAVSKILNTEMTNLGVGGVHSDLIKIYVENGFILYMWWLWYFLIHNTKKYAKRFNSRSAVVYFGITIYMFVLYTTDNSDSYFACQLLCIILPMTFATNERRRLLKAPPKV